MIKQNVLGYMIDNTLNEEELTVADYTLTPDIIIHTRNTNKNNLLVLEVKKDSNLKRNKEFDLLKLEHMTIDYNNNHYNYRVGAAITFGTKANAGEYTIRFFQNGIQCEREALI